MAKINILIPVILTYIFAMSSCIDIPLELALEKQITISESKILEVTNQIMTVLANINVTTTVGTNCQTIYTNWLKEQFKLGRLPTGIITPNEWGAGKGDVSTCKSVNFETEYKKAANQSRGSVHREALVFYLKDYSDPIRSNKFTAPFINPKRGKIKIKEINLEISKNKLNIPSPSFKLYTSDEIIEKDELAQFDAEQNLVDDGVLVELAHSESLPAGFTGRSPLIFVEDQEERKIAEEPLLSLDGSIVAIPEYYMANPVTKIIAGREYFIIPHGEVRLSVSLKIVISLSINDARRALSQFEGVIKEEDEERKKEFYQNKGN